MGDKIGEAFRAIARTPEFQSALIDPAVRADPANNVVLQAIQAGGGSGPDGVLQGSRSCSTSTHDWPGRSW